MDISAAGPTESAVFTLAGTLALRGSLGFTMASGNEGRNTLVMLLLTVLPVSTAAVISEGKRSVVLGVTQLYLLPALVASVWLMPPQYDLLRWAYVIFAGVLILIGIVSFILRLARKR